MANHI